MLTFYIDVKINVKRVNGKIETVADRIDEHRFFLEELFSRAFIADSSNDSQILSNIIMFRSRN